VNGYTSVYGPVFHAACTDYATPQVISNLLYANAPSYGLPFVPPVHAREGVLPPTGYSCKMRDVKDGASYTLTYVEDAGRPTHYIAGGLVGPANVDSRNQYCTNDR